MKNASEASPDAAVVDEVKSGDVAAAVPQVSKAGPVIEAWFGDLLQSIPVLRETETFNRMRAAVDDLKKRLQ